MAAIGNLALMLAKKDIENIVYRAEIMAEESGVSVREMLNEYIREIRKQKPYHAKILSMLEKRINSGMPRYRAYKGVLPEDVIGFLKIAEEKKIPPANIIKEYAPIREKYNSITKTVKKGVMFPMGLFLLLALILGNTIGKFKEIGDSGIIKFSDISQFIMNNFYLITMSIFVLMIVVFVLFPKKMPALKKIYQKTDSLLALSTISVLFSLGYSSAEIIKPIIDQFKLKVGRVQKDIGGLVKVLYEAKFVDPIEGAELKITMKHSDIERAIDQLKKKRNEDLENIKEIIAQVLKNLTIVITAVPVLMTIIVFMDLMMTVSQEASKF